MTKPETLGEIKMRHRIVFLILISLIVIPIANSDIGGSGTISLDARDSDIRDLLSGLAKANGLNLIMSGSVQGRITTSLKYASPEEAIKLILNANGFVMEKLDNLIVAGKPEDIKDLIPKVSKIIPIRYASADEIKQSLMIMAAGNAAVQADTRTNSIIISGTEASVENLESAIATLDVDLPSEIDSSMVTKIYKLKHAKASSMKNLVSDLLEKDGKASADDNTNSLVVLSRSSDAENISEIISRLDIESQSRAVISMESGRQIRVFKMNYIDAGSIKDIVQEVLGEEGKTLSFMKQKGSLPTSKNQYGSGSSFLDDKSSKDSSGSGSGSGSDSKKSSGGSGSKPGEQKWSDTLIVYATKEAIERVTELISKVDVRSPQVRIEAKMVEVTQNNLDQLGVDWNLTHSPSGSTASGYYPIISTEGIRTDGMEIRLGTLSTEYFENIMLRLRALETQGQAKLISNPSIMTVDNEPAQIVVADRIPVMSIYETEFRTTTVYEYINVGVILTVAAHITDEGYILMELNPEVASIKEWTSGDYPLPVISSRMAFSRVRMKNGETFVIGGLTKDEQYKSSSHIPFLGRIPLLGRLFGSKSIDNSKTELMIFITATISEDK